MFSFVGVNRHCRRKGKEVVRIGGPLYALFRIAVYLGRLVITSLYASIYSSFVENRKSVP